MFGLFKSDKKPVRAKILVVDDEPDYLSTIRCRLEWNNYEVVVAANGQEGLEKALSEHPALVLLDTNMPVMNGHEMLERLRRDPDLKDTPVIMVTALCDADDIAKVTSLGVLDYVAKPFNFAQLMEKIEKALETRKAGAET
jgi:two-component system cell cycle response regulator